MAFERQWLSIGSRTLISNGGADGSVVLSSTNNFRVKQRVKLSAIGEPDLVVEVKRVVSPTTLLVGPISSNIKTRIDISSYTTTKVATIGAEEQEKRVPTREDREAAIYEQEPVVAKRVIEVDEWGRFYSLDNPFPVQLSDGSIDIGTVNAELEVQLSHKDDDPDVGDIADSVQVGNGQYVLGINPDGSINVIAVVGGLSTPVIQNVPAPVAGNEYNITIPSTAKKYEIRCRGQAKINYAFVSGETGTKYITIMPGNIKEENNLNLSSDLTIYLQANKNNAEIEVLVWS